MAQGARDATYGTGLDKHCPFARVTAAPITIKWHREP